MIDGDRRRALSLIEARTISSDPATKRILDEASNDPIVLLEAVFDLFDGAVPQLRTEFGMIGFRRAHGLLPTSWLFTSQPPEPAQRVRPEQCRRLWPESAAATEVCEVSEPVHVPD